MAARVGKSRAKEYLLLLEAAGTCHDARTATVLGSASFPGGSVVARQHDRDTALLVRDELQRLVLESRDHGKALVSAQDAGVPIGLVGQGNHTGPCRKFLNWAGLGHYCQNWDTSEEQSTQPFLTRSEVGRLVEAASIISAMQAEQSRLALELAREKLQGPTGDQPPALRF